MIKMVIKLQKPKNGFSALVAGMAIPHPTTLYYKSGKLIKI
jgi:hypothetical protein